jgi:serine/threonine protein kinase
MFRYYGYSISEDKFCLITSLSKNGSLKDVLRSRLLNDENELLLIIKQISDGLHFLHTDYRNKDGLTRPPIAHRDLKTENILFINSNQLVICDFAMSTIIQLNQNGLNQEQQVYLSSLKFSF